MHSGDTIVAISSAVGPAARMIVRASGPGSPQLAAHLGIDRLPEANSAFRGVLRFSGLAVPAWLHAFRAPRSYTGEDLIEFHIPGNPLLARMLLDALVANGARPADPGEFTARAYFNGRIDLTEAEGVAATIAASGEQELRAARQLLAGELARRLRPATDLIAETLALVEVGIDFSDEDVTFLSPADVAERAARADGMLGELLDTSARFERLAHEPQVVLVGRPNAGKSTLLNALAGRERAVTSPVAGTTRDVLTAEVPLARGIIRLTDAAGLENSPGAPADDIAARMRNNALRAVESADVVVLVQEVTDTSPPVGLSRPPDLVVRTKSDLPQPARAGGSNQLAVSARDGTNLHSFRHHLDRLAFGDDAPGGASLALNARHLQAVADARAALGRAAERAGGMNGVGAELIALELREALDALGGVVGMVSPDDLLGRVFSAFCIGK